MNQVNTEKRRDEALTALGDCGTEAAGLVDAAKKYLAMYEDNEEIKGALEKAVEGARQAMHAFDDAFDTVEKHDVWGRPTAR